MNSELSSRSNIRSLRQLHKIDNKKMNDGEDQTLRSSYKKSAEILDDVGVGSFDENPLGASDTSSGSTEPVRGQVLDPLFDDFDQDQDEAEILEMQLQMKRLNAIEAQLERKKWLEQMKKELDDQKRRVREMKGKNPPPTKTSDPEIKIKTIEHSQVKTSDKGARPKTIEAISKLKVPASTDVDIKADSDTEQVTIESLRQNPKLQKQVKKELSKLGLKVISLKDESSSSERESSNTASSSDSESSKKKKKKHKSKKNKTDTESSSSSSSDDSDSSKKKKKKHKSKKHKKIWDKC